MNIILKNVGRNVVKMTVCNEWMQFSQYRDLNRDELARASCFSRLDVNKKVQRKIHEYISFMIKRDVQKLVYRRYLIVKEY